MKKLSLIPFLMLCCLFKVDAQNYGSFASGVFLTQNGTLKGYGVTGDATNQISATPLSGNLGTFQQNSGTLVLNGGETKTYKQNWANVCGSTLYYNVHTAGSAGTYSNISLPYKAGCNGGTFSDGLGNCGGNDQKWSTGGSSIDLTTLCPGNYTLDVYYSIPGSNNNTYDCGDNQYIGSAASPAGSATFTIKGTAPTVTVGTTDCYTRKATLTASNFSGDVTWSNGQTGASITAPVGTYTATSSLNGCISPKSAVATVEPCAIACPASGNLMVNGSFEEGVLPPDPDVTWLGIVQPGWTELVPANNGLIETWKSGSAGAPAPDGKQFIELNYNELGEISQDVKVIPNQPMRISYKHKRRGGLYSNINESLRLEVVDLATGQIIDSLTSTATGLSLDTYVGWHNFTTTFTPTNSDISIRFISLNASENGPHGYGNLLDDVILNYDFCSCYSPITIVGDTLVCQNQYPAKRMLAQGCNGGKISWTYDGEPDIFNFPNTVAIPGVSYVVGCKIPSCPDTNFSATVVVHLDETCEGTTAQRGINNAVGIATSASLSVAPNPVMDAATLRLSGFANGEVSIQITNLNGSVISNAKTINVNGIDLPLDMSTLRAGMYFIKAQQGGKVAVAKVAKK